MKTIDAEKLESALTVRIKWWMKPEAPDSQQVITALIDVRQCVREAAGINKGINED